MVQPKYSPEEALQRIKLMMKYDTSKTLNENVETSGIILTEQLGFGDIESVADDFNYYLTGDVETEDLTDIQNDLNTKIFGKRLKDGTCAMAKLLQYYEKISGNPSWKNFFGSTAVLTFGSSEWSRSTLVKDITNSKERGEAGFEDVKKELLDSIQKELEGFCKTQNQVTPPESNTGYTQRQLNINNIWCSVKNGVIVNPASRYNNSKWEDYKRIQNVNDSEAEIARNSCPKGNDPKIKLASAGKRQYVACSGTYKKGCKSNVIGRVQGCLGGLVPDNKFWDKTEARLKEVTGKTTFTDADVNTICKSKDTDLKQTPDIESGSQTVLPPTVDDILNTY